MNTGEDIQGLRKLADFTWLLSIAILAIHFYIACYLAFQVWGWTASITDRIVENISKTGLFSSYLKPKIGTLILLAVFLLSIEGKKDDKIKKSHTAIYILSGLFLYFGSTFLLYTHISIDTKTILYIGITGTGYLLMLIGGTWLSRLLKDMMNSDIFNDDNETFPQEERLLENEYSINLPAKYRLKKEVRDSWINFINPLK